MDQALAVSDALNLHFRSRRFGTRHPYLVRLREPDGPSTDQGRKARGSIVLVSGVDPNARPLVIGWVDATRGQAELRSYEALSSGYARRFDARLDISRTEIMRLHEELRTFLAGHGVWLRIAQGPAGPTSAPPERARTSTWAPWWFTAGFAAGFISAMAIAFLL